MCVKAEQGVFHCDDLGSRVDSASIGRSDKLQKSRSLEPSNQYRAVISDQKKRSAKERATTELKRFIGIAIYLWVLLSLFEIHRFAILRQVHSASHLPSYRIGFAGINALILGKVILIGEAFHVGERFSEKRLIYSALFKSAMFAVLVVCFNVIEGVIRGVLHGKSILASGPEVAGGGWEGMVLYGIMAFVVLIPFFLFTEMQRVLGKEQLHSIILSKRSKADAA